MPALSMFFGIVIYMYQRREHNPPHIHAIYQDHKAAFDFKGNIISGAMPTSQRRMIKAWIEIHKEELKANWKLAQAGEAVFRIDPLR